MLRSFAVSLILVLPVLAAKRPLTNGDYDGWRHIQNQQLSYNGHFLAYAVFPQVGDGELVVKSLATGAEIRESIGELPPPPPPNYAVMQTEETPPQQPGIAMKFSADNRFLGDVLFRPARCHRKGQTRKTQARRYAARRRDSYRPDFL